MIVCKSQDAGVGEGANNMFETDMLNRQYQKKKGGREYGAHALTITNMLTIVSSIIFHSCVCHAIDMKGVSYTAWGPNAMLTEDSDESLARAHDDGCNWIAICVWWFQDNVNSTQIEPDFKRYSATADSAAHAINRCHELGMKVLLKPMVDCRDGTWRGDINPSVDWFAEYERFISFWADIAEANKVEMLCIGCELKNTVSWLSSWESVIANTRIRYSGPLTYAANHGNEKNVNWWGNLDYIGIDAYYALTGKNNPTPYELKAAWAGRADAIESWRNANWPNMDVIFTEVGYQSTDGTNRTPWWTDPATSSIDLVEQADCYEALLSQCKARHWWLGAFWWNWETNPNGGGEHDPYWTPQNKPAQDVLRSHYITLPGDFDDDQYVDPTDVTFLAEHWLNSEIVGDPDLNHDGSVNLLDFAILAEHWRKRTVP